MDVEQRENIEDLVNGQQWMVILKKIVVVNYILSIGSLIIAVVALVK